MKVFISWSGKDSVSQKVAIELFNWLPMIIQNVEPWISTETTSGDRWNETINKNLSESAIGIICVTKENLSAPWLNFEAGAIAKGISSNKVIPLLIDIKPSDLSNSPLVHFQAKSLQQNDIQDLLIDINSLCERKIDNEILVNLFSHCWEDFNKKIESIISQGPKRIEKEKRIRPSEEILEEVLSLTRDIKNELSFRVSRLEQVFENTNRGNYLLDDIRNERFVDESRNRGFHYDNKEMEITDRNNRDKISMAIINDLINNEIGNMVERGRDRSYIIETLSQNFGVPMKSVKMMLDRYLDNKVNNTIDSSK